MIKMTARLNQVHGYLFLIRFLKELTLILITLKQHISAKIETLSTEYAHKTE